MDLHFLTLRMDVVASARSAYTSKRALAKAFTSAPSAEALELSLEETHRAISSASEDVEVNAASQDELRSLDESLRACRRASARAFI